MDEPPCSPTDVPQRSETPRPPAAAAATQSNHPQDPSTPSRRSNHHHHKPHKPNPPTRQRSLTEVLHALDLLHQTSQPVLLIGLDPSWLSLNRPSSQRNAHSSPSGSSSSSSEYSTFQTTFTQLQQYNPSLYMELHLLHPDSRENIYDVKRKIRDGSGPEGGSCDWTAVLWDSILRSDAELTGLFEDLVNFVREMLPAAKLVFPKDDADFAEALRRNLGVFVEGGAGGVGGGAVSSPTLSPPSEKLTRSALETMQGFKF